MARLRTQNELTSNLLDFFRIAQPGLDTKPGSVARDLVVDGPSAQIARLYNELGRVSALQSLRLALGIDLDRWADNLGIKRKRGSKSTVFAVFTFNTLASDFAIVKGEVIGAKNGATFVASSSTTISVVNAAQYKAFATQIRADLDFVGITDQYAVQVLCEATAPGIQGNISKFYLNKTSITEVNNITNVTPGQGGRPAETDAELRNRILAVFSGANTGTETGYRNAVISDPAVQDAVVIGPGDSLMTRDGTQVSVSADGTRTILSEGSGGKVDVLVYGIRLQETLDSIIYHDLSNTDDPTNSKNDFVLGQIASDSGKTVTRKRIDDLKNNLLPSQPVNNIIQVSGTLSGTSFKEASTDSLGRVTGNFSLVRDTGAYAGSPWGFDRLHWISDRISGFVEDKTKITFNGQDSLGFTDLLNIQGVTQNIVITNENSTVSASDRSSIQLAHYPVSNVTRVFNVTTGERYVVANQNPDGSGTVNTTGRIVITGKSLPAVSHVLQVDYTWVLSYDPYFDFDGRELNNNPRTVQDSIDWGLSNMVRRELSTLIAAGSYLSCTVIHSLSSVVSVNTFVAEDSSVSLSSGRLAVVVENDVENVVSVVRSSDGAELWGTNKVDGTFSGLTIFLPTDTAAVFNDSVSVVYNVVDVYNAMQQGNFSANVITIVPSDDATAGSLVEVTYVADVSTLLPATPLANLPAIRAGNGFVVGTVNLGMQPTTHLFDGQAQILSNLRQGPSNLGLNITGNISSGTLSISGTTITGVFDVILTVAFAGLKQDLSTVLRKALKLNSDASLPSNIRLARLVRAEKVLTTSGLDVLSVTATYDIKGYHIFDNTFVKDEAVRDTDLKTTEIILPETENNDDNVPASGDRLRLRFYYMTTSDTESVNFSKAGILYTQKKFAQIDTIAISSGFTSGSSAVATLTVTNLNQPATRSRYKVSYDYLAPKPNERITVRYNYDRLVTDSTLALEAARPVNADVLAKAASAVLADVTMKIGVTEEFINSSTVVLQNVQDAITSALNAGKLNTKVDASDLVNQAYTVTGVDSARIIFFNKTGKTGSVLNIQAQKNEFIRANNVIIELED